MTETTTDSELCVKANGFVSNGHTVTDHQTSAVVTNGVANGHCNGVNKNKSPSSEGPECTITGSTPFRLLMGELVKQVHFGGENNVFLTNYRLFVVLPHHFYNIPVKCIEYVEMREILNLHVVCKDGKVVRVAFESPDKCSEWWGYITQNDTTQANLEDLFAFQFYKKIKSSKMNEPFSLVSLDSADGEVLMFVNDNKRMEFNLKSIWRTTEINSKFEVCSTYPKLHIVPAWITDEDLQGVAQFRALRRFPSVVWRNKANGAVIARSSQPELGWFGWRCEKDEALLSAISQAAKLDCNRSKQSMTLSVMENGRYPVNDPNDFLLLDARSYTAAVANRAKGGGCECQEYYPNCDIQFMGLPNIHAIRKSFQNVRALCLHGTDQNNWYSALEATRWLQYISGLIRSSLVIVDAIHTKSRSTLVHCSDGWDRTAQLVSLAELLLDPYYRTIQGFRVLVEREWLNFGHKFTDRCGHISEKDPNERSPVFFQWLDAIHQIMKQYPSAFEFNENFLMKLLQHVYGCLFGTFLCNSARERRQLKLKDRTVSIWDLLLSGRKDFRNYLYNSGCHVLYPSYHVRHLVFWENAFIPSNSFTSKLRTFQQRSSNNIDPSPPVRRKNSRERTLSADNCDVTNEENVFQPIAVTVCEKEAHVNGDIHSHEVPFCKREENNTEAVAESCEVEPSVNGDTNSTNDTGQAIETINNNSSTSLENELDNTLHLDTETVPTRVIKQGSVDDSCMTDSSRTITNDNETDVQVTSFDDSYVGGIHGSPQAHRSNGFIRANSAPDSPTMNTLLRTKSVPDVMTASVCVHADLTKYYPHLEGQECKTSLESNFSKYVDVDGLAFCNTFIDEKLQEIHSTHAHEIGKLQKRLEYERQRALANRFRDASYSSAYSDGQDDVEKGTSQDVDVKNQLSLPDSMSGERSSVSSISNDDGWEQVQIDEVQPTRWLPDHLSPTCLHCGCTFTILYRRHHCRKCGGVFCDTCSNYKIPIPEEQHYQPVRVCMKCYERHLAG